MSKIKLKFKLLSKSAELPEYKHTGDAAFDIYSSESLTIKSKDRGVVSTGIASEIPEGWFVSIRDRSGLAVNNGIHVLAGVIDSNYRGEWKVILANFGSEDFKIEKGDRIAQGVLHEVPNVKIIKVNNLSDNSHRGDKGFGSSGKK